MILKKDIITDKNPLLRNRSEDVTFPLSKEDKQNIKDFERTLVEFSVSFQKS